MKDSYTFLGLERRVDHALVYIAGIPCLRRPVYPVSWLAILAIA